jgi:hypothetical protein
MIVRLLLGAIGAIIIERIVEENRRRPSHVARPHPAMAKPAPDDGQWVDVSARLDR